MKVHKLLSVLFLFLLISVTALAQDCSDGPGLPGDDPDAHSVGNGGCPLDTWVIILFIGALILTTSYLYRKQKAQITVN